MEENVKITIRRDLGGITVITINRALKQSTIKDIEKVLSGELKSSQGQTLKEVVK